jgi:hypothetical protein
MAAQTFRARGMSFPPDDSFGWLDDLYAVPSTGESDDGCLLFFDPKNARRIFYVHINRLLVHIGTFDPVHIGLLLSAKLTTAWTVQFHLPLPCRCRGRATGRPCGDSCWQRLEIPGRSKGTQRAAHAVSLALSPMSALKRIVLKKSFWGDDQNFSGPLTPFARGDMRGPHRLTQKRPRSFVCALRSIAVVESAKNRLLRDFRRRSIFDFCNTIKRIPDSSQTSR